MPGDLCMGCPFCLPWFLLLAACISFLKIPDITSPYLLHSLLSPHRPGPNPGPTVCYLDLPPSLLPSLLTSSLSLPTSAPCHPREILLHPEMGLSPSPLTRSFPPLPSTLRLTLKGFICLVCHSKWVNLLFHAKAMMGTQAVIEQPCHKRGGKGNRPTEK